MTVKEQIIQRRKQSVFQAEYARHAPNLEQHMGTCVCCGKSFEYLDALNRFEDYVERRGGPFIAYDTFKGDMCFDCAYRSLEESTWLEIL